MFFSKSLKCKIMKKLDNKSQIYLTKPMENFNKTFFTKTVNFVISNVEFSEKEMLHKSKDINAIIFSNYCHIVYDFIIRNKRVNVNIELVKKFVRIFFSKVSFVFKNRFSCNNKEIETISNWMNSKKYRDTFLDLPDGVLNTIPGINNKHNKNFYH